MKFRTIAVLFASLWLSGCATDGYKEFYRPAPSANLEVIAAKRVAPPPAVPILERSPFVEGKILIPAYAKRGYVAIGSSIFNAGGDQSEANALKQGKAVGADLVLVFSPKYTGSVTTSVPITTPTTSTSYTSGSATAYGSGGAVNAYGNSTTTTYGSETNYIPVTVRRSDYGAVYFVKQRFAFGAFYRNLDDAERQEMQTNQGVVVTTVVDDSPAFMADILPSDMIVAVDGSSVANGPAFERILHDNAGKQITVRLKRKGQQIDKVVQLAN